MKDVFVMQMTTERFKEMIATIVQKEIAKIKDPDGIGKPELMSRDEVASLFNISLPTLHKRMNMGDIRAHKMGRKTIFKRSEIIEDLKRFDTKKYEW